MPTCYPRYPVGEQVPHDREIVFTIEVKPETVEVDGHIGADADTAEAFALCQRLFDAVRDFKECNRAETG